MTEITELLLPSARRARIVRLQRSGGGLLELAGLGAALLLLLATMYVGGTGSPGRTTSASVPHAPVAALPQVAAAPIITAAPPMVAAPVVMAAAVVAGKTPTVVGMTREAAAAALLAAGYRSISWVAESAPGRLEGSVVRQEPAAGSAVQSVARLIVAR